MDLRFPKKKKAGSVFYRIFKCFFAPGWEDDPHPTYKTDEISIQDVDYNKLPKLDFIFDFGDGHRFDIEFKGNRALKKNEKDQ